YTKGLARQRHRAVALVGFLGHSFAGLSQTIDELLDLVQRRVPGRRHGLLREAFAVRRVVRLRVVDEGGRDAGHTDGTEARQRAGIGIRPFQFVAGRAHADLDLVRDPLVELAVAAAHAGLLLVLGSDPVVVAADAVLGAGVEGHEVAVQAGLLADLTIGQGRAQVLDAGVVQLAQVVRHHGFPERLRLREEDRRVAHDEGRRDGIFGVHLVDRLRGALAGSQVIIFFDSRARREAAQSIRLGSWFGRIAVDREVLRLRHEDVVHLRDRDRLVARDHARQAGHFSTTGGRGGRRPHHGRGQRDGGDGLAGPVGVLGLLDAGSRRGGVVRGAVLLLHGVSWLLPFAAGRATGAARGLAGGWRMPFALLLGSLW
ncbi:unnamed protein product, partial [Pelagomonas calceolata]